MAGFAVSAVAGQRLDEIYVYTRDHWGQDQAQAYIRALFACFAGIAERALPWRAIPVEFGVDGFFCRCQHHYVYWRVLGDGRVGIVTVLHERMHQIARLRDDMAP